MKLKAHYWVPGLALLAAVPAWANYSWGQIGQFRPGIQLGIVVLVLVAEVLVVKPLLQMNWRMTALAVVLANAVSAFLGSVLIAGMADFTNMRHLLALTIPSTIVEFIVIGAFAQAYSGRDHQRAHWTFVAAFAANLLSALVTFGYLYADYRGGEQPIPFREAGRMQYLGKVLATGFEDHGGSIAAICADNKTSAGFLAGFTTPGQSRLFDVAPPWLPWAQLRLAPCYESAIPARLEPPGRGRPMVWTGAPCFAGKRGVIFSDGRFEMVAEKAFRQLGASPAPPQVTIPVTGSVR